MILGEPPRTAYDLQFSIAGIPVRVHPLFWLAGVILGASSKGAAGVLLWVAALFVSILIHELGHALMMRFYGMNARIVLYMMGGLAIPEGKGGYDFGGYRQHSPMQQIVICFAGPGAGFLFAALLAFILVATGGQFGFAERFPFFWDAAFPRDTSPHVVRLFHNLMYVNIFWGAVNLLPIYPLDGGQISREIFTVKDPYNGVVRSLWVSVFAAGAVAVYGLSEKSIFLALLFGSLAYSSYTAIEQLRGGGYGGGYGGGGNRPW